LKRLEEKAREEELEKQRLEEEMLTGQNCDHLILDDVFLILAFLRRCGFSRDIQSCWDAGWSRSGGSLLSNL
jgi:hypothetical protein